MSATAWKNKLYFGDNLDILRRYVEDESVDLIYLDPPFNSKATYNVLFKEKNGTDSVAQITAFDDFWHWDMAAEAAFREVVGRGDKVGDLLDALRRFLGSNDMMAYLTMMAIRLVELHRVLKPTGSIYLHCDPTASHYLKLVMDAVFGIRNFRNEVIWKRSSAHSDSGTCGNAHDVLLLFTKGPKFLWNRQYQAYDEAYITSHYGKVDEKGRRFGDFDLTAKGLSGGGYEYEWKGIREIWRCPLETMEQYEREGRLYYTKKGRPRYKRYLDEMPGLPLQDVWVDIPPINSQAAERLGYPTQKPEALLERIIKASSNEGDLVLDPFCGCGTTIAVAERLHRRWIGIDITHLAITLMKSRLQDTFGPDLSPYEVIGEPTDLASAQSLAQQDRYQFQYWALGLVGARPTSDKQKKGADKGIDGQLIFFDDDSGRPKRIVIQVKSGHVNANHVRDLRGTVEREKAQIGAFITLQPPTRAMRTEAAEAGFYDPPGLLPPVPKLQILTVEELLAGKKLEYPVSRGGTFRKAPKQFKRKSKGKAGAQ